MIKITFLKADLTKKFAVQAIWTLLAVIGPCRECEEADSLYRDGFSGIINVPYLGIPQLVNCSCCSYWYCPHLVDGLNFCGWHVYLRLLPQSALMVNSWDTRYSFVDMNILEEGLCVVDTFLLGFRCLSLTKSAISVNRKNKQMASLWFELSCWDMWCIVVRSTGY